MLKRRALWTVVLLLLLLQRSPGPVLAAETGRDGPAAGTGTESGTEPHFAETELLEEFDLSRIETFLQRQNGAAADLSFRELLQQLLAGKFEEIAKRFLEIVRDRLFREISENGRWLGQVLLLGMVGAVFAGFSGIFSGGQIAESGFYVTYLLIFTLLSASFLNGAAVTRELLERIIEYMRALVPSFFLAVSFAGGSAASAAGCGWMLFSVSCVEWVFLRLLLPLIRIELLLVLAGHLIREDLFSKMTELLEQGIRWGIKGMTGMILGFHMLQGMVVPYGDSMKHASLRQLVSAIPGIGQGAAAASQMILGAGVLLKNTIGAGAVIVLVLLSLVPLMKLILLYVFCQGAAAVLQPVSDKRIVACVSAVAAGSRLLLAMAGASLLLFGISLAIICVTTNAAYFS